MPTSPLISVTLPNYNYGRFLAQSFQTVLAQSYTNFEILFTDDGSTDESRAIAADFARQDRRIKPVYFEKNRGAMPAHANTWARARGSLVYQYSSDDCVQDPDFFRLGVEALARHPDAAGFYGIAGVFSAETGQRICQMGHADIEGYIAPRDFLVGFLSKGYFVPGISSLWRMAAIHSVGGYDPQLGPQADYFINHALPSLAGVVFMRRHLTNARTFSNKTGFSSSAKLEQELERFSLFAAKLRKLTARFGSLDAEWAAWRRYVADQISEKYKDQLVQSLNPASI